MGNILPPPATNVPIVIDKDEPKRRLLMSPTWYRLFLDLIKFINQSGGALGATPLADFQAHLDDTEDAHDASAVSFVPAAGLTSDNVQDAIEEVAGLVGGGGTAGVYTPTLTNVANLDASAAFECQYIQVGAVVSVSGKVTVDPTAPAAATKLGISLPVASNLGAEEDCSGVAFSPSISGQGAAILGDAANNRAQLEFVSGDLSSRAMFFQFQYTVI